MWRGDLRGLLPLSLYPAMGVCSLSGDSAGFVLAITYVGVGSPDDEFWKSAHCEFIGQKSRRWRIERNRVIEVVNPILPNVMEI